MAPVNCASAAAIVSSSTPIRQENAWSGRSQSPMASSSRPVPVTGWAIASKSERHRSVGSIRSSLGGSVTSMMATWTSFNGGELGTRPHSSRSNSPGSETSAACPPGTSIRRWLETGSASTSHRIYLLRATCSTTPTAIRSVRTLDFGGPSVRVGDLFVVYNHNVRELLQRWQLDSNQLLVKFQYALRY